MVPVDTHRDPQSDDDATDLHEQVATLEEEVAVLRRRLQEAPKRVRTLEERLLEANRQSEEEFCAQADACISHSALDRLGEIEAPTLIIVGDRDVLTPAHHAYAIKEQLPQARVRVWQKMGHAPHWEAPAEFAAICRDFLAGH